MDIITIETSGNVGLYQEPKQPLHIHGNVIWSDRDEIGANMSEHPQLCNWWLYPMCCPHCSQNDEHDLGCPYRGGASEETAMRQEGQDAISSSDD